MIRNKGKTRMFSLLLVIMGCISLIAAGMSGQAVAASSTTTIFPDISGDDSNAVYVKYLVNKGIISGYSDGGFHPNEGLTRAQAAVVMVKATGLKTDPSLECPFTDVSNTHWARDYVTAAAKAGYIQGMPDGTFKPEEKLTRAQGISLILRLSKQDQSNATLPQLSDMDSSHWAAKAVATGVASGMVGLTPDGNKYLPEAPFTRIALAHALGLLLTEDPDLCSSSLPGTLKPIGGDIKLKKSSGEELSINKETPVGIGDRIITGSNGSCDLVYPDGSSMLVKESTEISIKDAQGRKYIKNDGSEGIAVDWLNVDLKKGTMLTALATRHEVQKSEETQNVGKLNPGNERLYASLEGLKLIAAGGNPEWYKVSSTKKVKVKVDMPYGVASVRGTFIMISVSPSGQSSVSCLTGSAEVSNQGVTVPLSQGQGTAVTAPAAPPTPTAALDAVAVQQFVQSQNWIQETAKLMDEVQEAAPSTPPPAVPTEALTTPAVNTPVTPTTPAANTPTAPTNSQLQSTLDTVNQALEGSTSGTAPTNNTTNNTTTPSTPSGGGSGGSGGGDTSPSIQMINDLMDTVVEGEPYQLPEVVTAIMSNGTTRLVGVNWDTSNPDTNIVGMTIITGTVPGYANPVKLTLAVGRRLGTPAPITAGQPILIQGGISVDLGSMSIPEGATVTVAEVSAPDLGTSGVQTAGKVVDINFSNMDISQPVELSLPLDAGVDPNKSAIYLYNDGQWEYQPSQFQNGAIVATVSHFSIYGVLLDENPPENVLVSKGNVNSGNVELLFSAEDISGEIKYQVYRNGELLTTSNDDRYMDEGLESGSEYHYQIKAIDRFENISEFSPVLDVTVIGNDADLSGLTISSGTLDPIFEKDTLNYTASVSCEVESIDITATAADEKTKVAINSNPASEGESSASIDLDKGENTISIVTIAEDETTSKTYTLIVTRSANNYANLSGLELSLGTIEPAFEKDTLSYTASVSREVENISITAIIEDEKASLTINGNPVAVGESGSVNLEPGENAISIVVSAEDETTTKTYTLVITRAGNSNADLDGLAISSGPLSPVFNKDILSYTAMVSKEVEELTLSLTLADPAASLKVNGAEVSGAAPSVPIALNTGENVISIEVTAEDGTTIKTYTLTINKSAKNSNAYLGSLSSSVGSLSPGFDKEQGSYSSYVPYYIGSISINVTPEDSLATVSINGSLGSSSTVNINEGTNSISITVTAEDGITTRDYSLTVMREATPPPPPPQATADVAFALTSPTGDGNTISGGGATRTVTVNVVNNISSVGISGSKAAAQTLTIGGTNASAVAAAGTDTVPTYMVDTDSIKTDGGSKTFTLTVSESGKTDIVYTITVNVAEPLPASAQISGVAKLSDFTDVADAHAGIIITIRSTLEGGDPIEFSTSTNSDGSYSIANLPACNFVLEASKSGYCSTNTLVQTTDNQTTINETILLIPEIITGSVKGYAKFIDKEEYQGIGIQIQTLEGILLPNLIAMTDSNGYFEFDKVPVSGNSTTYIFTAFALDNSLKYGTDSIEVTVQANNLTTIPNILWLRPAAVDLIIFADDPTAWDDDNTFRAGTPLYDMLQKFGDNYTIYPSSQMSSLDLPVNKTVWIINDQPQDFYSAYKANQARFDYFVNRGGTLLFEACDSGWNGGSLSSAAATLPGGVVNAPCYDYSNININPTHPMMSGVPINMTGNYASHNYFTNLPDIATVLCSDSQNHPTLVEYKFGQGRVVATGQTLEKSYSDNWNLKQIYPNMIAYTFNKPTAAGLTEPYFVLSNGNDTIEPLKSQNTITYTATVGADVSQLTVTPTASQGTITVNGLTVNSGNASQSIDLNYGTTLIRIVVFEDAKLPRTYTIAVTRELVNITEASITGLVTPATGEDPTAAGALTPGAQSYTATSIIWLNADGTNATLTDGKFSASSSYKAQIVLTSATGYKFPADELTPTVDAGTAAAGTVGGGDVSGNTLTFEVAFAETGAMIPTDITAASIGGLVAPVTGTTPIEVGALSRVGEAATYSITSITWQNADGSAATLIEDGKFEASSIYKAQIILTSEIGYKFLPDGLTPTVNTGTPGVGTVEGGDVSGNTLTFIVTFPETGAPVLTDIASASIGGMIAPVTGATPISKEVLTRGAEGYSVTSITWQNADGSAATLTDDGKFEASSIYKAQIILTSEIGYKFLPDGLTPTVNTGTAAAGTVGGGDVSGNTLTFEVTFTETGAMIPTDITAASITGLVAPVTGTTPIEVGALSRVGEAATYSITSITWLNANGTEATLTDGEFSASSSYKAQIILTSEIGYKFLPDGLTPTVNAGTPGAGTVGGGDVSGNTLTFEVTFDATLDLTPA